MTLDDDVAAKLRARARATARPFRAIVNDTLRAGLEAVSVEPMTRFEVTPFDLGLRSGLELDSIQDLLDRVEGVEHR